jgi:hypothetical protein
MRFFSWVQSLFVTVPHSKGAGGNQGAQIKTGSLHGKSASQITSELARRGNGDMATGVTRTAQKAFWQGRTIQQNIDKGPRR